jgi:hypothetical protein
MKLRVTAVVVTLATFAAVVFCGARASADAPTTAGWWTVANPGPFSLPVGSDVPKGGLLVEGGSGSAPGAADSSPVAYAAVVYKFDAGATPGALTLKVPSGSASTPTAVLQLCPLKSDTFKAAQGAPIADAPPFSCQNSVTAALASNGSSYTFYVSSLSTDNELAVAILPTSPSDRVVLAAPGADSLPITPGNTDAASATPAGADAASATPADAGSTSQAPSLTGGPSDASSLPSIAASTGAAATTPASSSATPSTPRAGNFPISSANIASTASKGAVAFLVAALLMGLVEWELAGRKAVRTALGEGSET